MPEVSELRQLLEDHISILVKTMQIAMAKPSRFWFLNAYEQSFSLPEGECLHLSSGKVLKRFERAALLENNFDQNTSIYCLKEGLLKICKLSSKGETLKSLVYENQFFGEMALAEAEDPCLFATATQDCKLSYIHLPAVNKVMEKYPDFREHMLERISMRVKNLENQLEELINQDSRSRVIGFLNDLACNIGQIQPGKKVVPNFLKNKEIAQLTFTSRQTVNAVMNELKRNKQIEFDQNSITFHNKGFQF